MHHTMYIKKVRKSNRNSRKIYEYLHLVENVRTDKGPRQKLILNLGNLDVPAKQYKELANCIETMLTGRKQLFSPDPKIEKHARKALQKIRAKKNQTQPDNKVDPSEPAGVVYQNVDTASMQAGEMCSLYRAGDSLFECKDSLESHLAREEKELFSLPERMCLFDLTNTYFEGRASGNPNAQRGRSKEKRSDCKLLTLALVVDEHGFAKYSQLYPGNQAECKTLAQIIEKLICIRPNLAKDRTVVLDAGIATKKNIKYLRKKQFHYIVVNRGKGDFTVADTQQMKVIRQTDEYTLEVKRQEQDGQALLLCRSSARKSKDYGIRNRQEQLFVERLQYYHDGLGKKGHTKRYAKVVEMIGRLREKYPRASKLYEVTVVPEDKPVKSVNARAVVWKKRAQYDEISKFDGCYVLRTDRLDLTDKEIWETYVMLTRVESAFRSMKSSLGLRPNFHQNGERADAHMFISVLAYHILHTIEYRLRQGGDHRLWATVRAVLSTHQRLTIEYNVKEHKQVQRHHLRLCSNAEPEHKQIYENLGLSNVPLPRKLHAAK